MVRGKLTTLDKGRLAFGLVKTKEKLNVRCLLLTALKLARNIAGAMLGVPPAQVLLGCLPSEVGLWVVECANPLSETANSLAFLVALSGDLTHLCF